MLMDLAIMQPGHNPMLALEYLAHRPSIVMDVLIQTVMESPMITMHSQQTQVAHLMSMKMAMMISKMVVC